MNILNGRPQNLLIDNDLHLKLADFGLARAFVVGRRAWLIFAAVPQLRHATQVPIPKYTHEAALEVELDGFDTDLGLKSHVNVDICNIYVDTRSIKINRRIHIFALTEVVTVWYRAPEILLGSVGLLSAG